MFYLTMHSKHFLYGYTASDLSGQYHNWFQKVDMKALGYDFGTGFNPKEFKNSTAIYVATLLTFCAVTTN